MRSHGGLVWVLVGGFLSVSAPATGVRGAGKADLSWVLPPPAQLKPLAPTDQPQQAVGDELWRLINGGAGVFLRAGFERIMVQDYKSAAGQRYGIEVYQMGTPEGARQVYGKKGGLETTQPTVGQACTFADYYAFVRQGRFFVTVTAYEKDDETRVRLEQLAAAVVDRIRAREAGNRAAKAH